MFFMHYIYRFMCIYKGFCYMVLKWVWHMYIDHTGYVNKGSPRFSTIADSRGMPQFVHTPVLKNGPLAEYLESINQSITQAWVISRVFNAYTRVKSNWFASLIHALATISRVILQTFRVLVRDMHSSVNFELNCTVSTYMYKSIFCNNEGVHMYKNTTACVRT